MKKVFLFLLIFLASCGFESKNNNENLIDKALTKKDTLTDFLKKKYNNNIKIVDNIFFCMSLSDYTQTIKQHYPNGFFLSGSNFFMLPLFFHDSLYELKFRTCTEEELYSKDEECRPKALIAYDEVYNLLINKYGQPLDDAGYIDRWKHSDMTEIELFNFRKFENYQEQFATNRSNNREDQIRRQLAQYGSNIDHGFKYTYLPLLHKMFAEKEKLRKKEQDKL